MVFHSVSEVDIRKIIYEQFNNTEQRFSNDGILALLKNDSRFESIDDVLDIEDILLNMENCGLLRPIAQNFNTRYYRIHKPLQLAKCESCNRGNYVYEGEKTKCLSCGQQIHLQ